MKRYTGQKSLYEAISRSRAKAKQGSILEKLRSAASKPEDPPIQEVQPPVEAEQAPEEMPELVASEPSEPPEAETPPEPVAESEPQAEPALETPPEPPSEVLPEPVEQAEPVARPRPIERVARPVPPGAVQPLLRPRAVQLNEGRIEISVPYYVGAIVGLAAMLVVLVAFRLGQARSGGQPSDAGGQVQSAAVGSGVPATPPTRAAAPNAATATVGQTSVRPSEPASTRQGGTTVASQGDHLIVLARSKRQEDMEPVIRFFAANGIELLPLPLDVLRKWFADNNLSTGHLPSGDGFLLVTRDPFRNPNEAGTDGANMLRRVVEVGAQYRTQPGSQMFAPHYFSDAYGMKIR